MIILALEMKKLRFREVNQFSEINSTTGQIQICSIWLPSLYYFCQIKALCMKIYGFMDIC